MKENKSKVKIGNAMYVMELKKIENGMYETEM